MLRRFLLGALVVSLASMAWAGVPDLSRSSVDFDAAANGASIYCLPNGGGAGFDEALLAGGTVVDATITITLLDENDDPVVLFPFEDMWLETSGGGLVYCDGGTTADGSTDEFGVTEWQNPLNAGGSSAGETTMVYVAGTQFPSVALSLTFNSADINGDLVVNLSDVIPFAQSLGTGDYQADFNFDGIVNLSDVIPFAVGLGASCN